MAKAAVKTGRTDGYTPAELLIRYGTLGDKHAGALWAEYARAFKSENQLRWSPGLRKALRLGAEQSDEEIANDHPDDSELVAYLRWEQYKVILGNDIQADTLMAARGGFEV